MTEVPKIVRDRLRAAALEGARNAAEPTHPDANLLTAFAEQSLTATERDGVLDHLALCGDCRDAVALALPAEDMPAVSTAAESEAEPISSAPKPAPHKIFIFAWWPSLRWAALAAGIVIAGSVLLLRPGKLNQPPANPQIASTAEPSTAPGAPSGGAPPIATPSANERPGGSANSDEANLVIEAPLSKDAPLRKLRARRSLTRAPQLPAEAAMAVAGNKKSSPQADKLANMPGAMAMDDSARAQAAGGAAGQTTEAAAATSEVSAASPDTALVALDEAPAIEKAKPAVQGAQVVGTSASGANQQQAPAAAMAGLQGRTATSNARLSKAANTTSAAGFAQHDFVQHNFAWTIKAGILQRSLDGGQTWQDNLHAERALLCYASHNSEIWAGGAGGALYHSIDGGLNWIQVHPTSESRQLIADVSHIDLRNASMAGNNSAGNDTQAPTEIVLSTSNKESWTSTDGGKNWKAQ